MNSKYLTSLSVAALIAAGTTVASAEPLKVGVLATLEGTYTVLGEDGVRGLKTALAQAKNMGGGREIELVIGATDASPDSAVRAARKLVEQDGVELVIGPLSGSEGIAIRDYSKTQPQVTFLNGISGAQETTYVTPSDNFFRFNMDGAQWSAGLGDYIFNDKGYKTIATVGEDYSFVYTQVFGLVTEFCAAGGEVTERLWVPLGTKDFGSIIAALPDDVDAIYLGLGGGDAVNFLNQYQQARWRCQSHRRHDHGRRHSVVIQGICKRSAGRNTFGGSAGRYLGRSEVAGLRKGLSGHVPAGSAFPVAVTVGDWILQRHQRCASVPQ